MVTTAMVKKEERLLGVAKGSNPLEVLVPAFEVKTVEQNTPFAAVINTITVSIKANCDLLPGSTVTIHELTGSAGENAAGLAVEHGSGGFASTGVWLKDGNMTLTSTGMNETLTYEARFNLTNPPTSQTSPTVMVRASAKSVYGDISPVVTTAMVRPARSLLSVLNGLDPLQIHVPSFTVHAIGQSHPFPGSSNILTVTFAVNCDLQGESLITVAGLTGSLTSDMAQGFAVDTSSPQWFSSASWIRSEGILTLKLFSSEARPDRARLDSYISVPYNTSFVFWFHLRNSFAVQASPPVNISAAVWSPWGPNFSPISEQEMTKEHATVLQIPTASDPLFIWNVTFLTKIMGQNNPLSKASNTLTVTLQANFQVQPGSNITMSGMTGTLTPDNLRLGLGDGPILNHSHSLSMFSADSSRWTQEDGTLVVIVASSLNAFEEYVLAFELRNPERRQPNPTLFMQSTLESGLQDKLSTLQTPRYPGLVNSSEMDLAREFRFGIENASLPLLTIIPIFEVKYIRQDFLYPQFLNTLSVSLKTNCNLTANTVITISGLTGTLTNATELAILETQDMGYQVISAECFSLLSEFRNFRVTSEVLACASLPGSSVISRAFTQNVHNNLLHVPFPSTGSDRKAWHCF